MLQRYLLKPIAPLITPLMSDTIFGHFCWYLRYQKSEEELVEFLQGYEKCAPVPVLFSSAFLSGHLPRPILPTLGRNALRTFVAAHFGNSKKSQFDGFSKIKSWNKRHLITIPEWELLKDDYTDETLYEQWSKATKEEHTSHGFVELSSHNRISRDTGTVPPEGGGLYTREKKWYRDETVFDLYVMINDPAICPAVNDFLVSYLPNTGFGADKSVGMGSLTVSEDVMFNPGDFQVEHQNARMVLSLTAFSDMGRYPSYYRLMTKFGKLGGDFAVTSPTGGDVKPFKRPILMYEEGSVFIGEDLAFDKVALLAGVHSDERIRHCGIPLTLPLKIREGIGHDKPTAA